MASSATASSRATVAVATVAGSAPTGDLAFLGPLHTVPVGGITMGFRQFGTGSPVLLIVGQDSPMGLWGPDLPRRLAEHHQVTMFDNRGVGASTDQADRPLTIELMGDDTAGLIQALGLHRPTVVGWSTGGEIALALAVGHPGVAGPLVLSGATAGGPTAIQTPPAVEAQMDTKLLDYLFTSSGATARAAYIAGVTKMPSEDVAPATIQRQADAETRFAGSTVTYQGQQRGSPASSWWSTVPTTSWCRRPTPPSSRGRSPVPSCASFPTRPTPS